MKEKLAFAVNNSKIFETKGIETRVPIGDGEDDLDIPMPSFATSSSGSSSSTSKNDKGKGKKIAAPKEIKPLNPEDIKIGMPIRDGDFSSGCKEIKSTANGKKQKLETAGIRTNISLAFTTSLEDDFKVEIMNDEYYGDDD